jgi:hypothetical protein
MAVAVLAVTGAAACAVGVVALVWLRSPQPVATGPAPAVTPEAFTAAPEPSPGMLPAGWAACVNDTYGFVIGRPAGWQGMAGGADACLAFDRPETDADGSDLAVEPEGGPFADVMAAYSDGAAWRIVSRLDTNVAGRAAVRVEAVATETADRVYAYIVERDGIAFIVRSSLGPDDEADKDVVDAAVLTLRFV